MSYIAYKDKDRTQMFYSNQASNKDKSTRYFCPNPNCDAHMYVCAVDGSVSAYFSATRKQFPHIDGCSYKESNKGNNINYDESSFDFNDIIKSLYIDEDHNVGSNVSKTNKNNRLNKKCVMKITTISQLYDLCKSKSCEDQFNGFKIKEMLLDERSSYMDSKGIFGNKLIEARVNNGYFYDNKESTILLQTPIINNKYKIKLQFTDKKIFNDARNKLFNNKDKIVIVSGKWKTGGKPNEFCTEVTSKKQYHVLNIKLD